MHLTPARGRDQAPSYLDASAAGVSAARASQFLDQAELPHPRLEPRLINPPANRKPPVEVGKIQRLARAADAIVPDPEALLARVVQAVPTGGYFISKTPCLGARGMALQSAAMRLMIPLMQLIGKAPPVVRFFSTEGLEAMITRAGFDVVEAGSFPGGKPPSYYIVARRRG